MQRPERNSILSGIALDVSVRRLLPICHAHRHDERMHPFDVVEVDIEITDLVGWCRDLLGNRALGPPSPQPPPWGAASRRAAAGYRASSAAAADPRNPRRGCP